MKATVSIGDDAFTVDFTGSAGMQKGPVNMPLGTTLAMCKVVFKSLTTPGEPVVAISDDFGSRTPDSGTHEV